MVLGGRTTLPLTGLVTEPEVWFGDFFRFRPGAPLQLDYCYSQKIRLRYAALGASRGAGREPQRGSSRGDNVPASTPRAPLP